MSAIPPPQHNEQETHSSCSRIWPNATPITETRWREPNTLKVHTLVPGSIVGIDVLFCGKFEARMYYILGIRISATGGQILIQGQRLITREKIRETPAGDATAFAVTSSIGYNELVRFGRTFVCNIDHLSRMISPVTVFDCQNLSLPRVDTPEPFVRLSISLVYGKHPTGGLSMVIPDLLLPMCVPKCKLTRIAYSPDFQYTHWCAQCQTWVHRNCMDRAPPVPVPERIASFVPAPGQENAAWDALLVAPIVRIPRGRDFPPFSIELLIRDVRASRGRPADIKQWFKDYPYRSLEGLLLGDWTYYTCPRCCGRI